jgi:hypothetical protein
MLVGRWHIEHDGVTSEDRSDGAEVRYHARSMYAVISLSGVKRVRVDVVEDGQPLPKQEAGSDVQFDSKGAYIDVADPRMYYIIRSPAFSAHLVSLEPQSPGLRPCIHLPTATTASSRTTRNAASRRLARTSKLGVSF